LQDECKAAFFEGRYKSIAILDEEALLTVCAYIDLNPVAAGIVSLPEESPHTSIKPLSTQSLTNLVLSAQSKMTSSPIETPWKRRF